MSNEMIIWICSIALGGVDIASLIAVAVFILKGVAKRVEDSTGLKGELGKLNKRLSEALEQNEELKSRLDTYALEVKGLKQNVSKNVRKN